MRRLCLALIVSLLVSSSVQAHFAWLVVDKVGADRTVSLYFSESLSPGSAHLVENFSQAKFIAVSQDGKHREIEAKLVEDGDKGSLTAVVPAGVDRCVELGMTYGVHREMLVHYFAKALMSGEETSSKSASDSAHPLKIKSKKVGSELELTVTWNGEGLADTKVAVHRPDADSETVSTDADGKVRVNADKNGRYGFLASHIQTDKSGEYEGEKYARAGHFTTLSLNVSTDQPASKEASNNTPEESSLVKDELTATQLLANARSARNVWEDGFPGFSADVVVAIGPKSVKGGIEVNADGEIEWTFPERKSSKWAKGTVRSLVNHRMPTGELGDKASYVDQVRNHPLGHKISLDEDAMGSVYRVRDNVVRQVNRDAGPSRFTITVLDVSWDEKHRYLPTTYSVASWNRQTGAIDFSSISHHTYQRVGGFDLPQRLVELRTGPDNTYEIKEIKFSNLRLNTKELIGEAGSN